MTVADKNVIFEQHDQSLEMKLGAFYTTLSLNVRQMNGNPNHLRETKLPPGQDQRECYFGGFLWCSVSRPL
jgi:hypothetical protein